MSNTQRHHDVNSLIYHGKSSFVMITAFRLCKRLHNLFMNHWQLLVYRKLINIHATLEANTCSSFKSSTTLQCVIRVEGVNCCKIKIQHFNTATEETMMITLISFRSIVFVNSLGGFSIATFALRKVCIYLHILLCMVNTYIKELGNQLLLVTHIRPACIYLIHA